ncbi:hypothetical protein [Methylobacterium sp. ID0610]|uniref:hypothetical protein n=1 Tax=Methylobacterium carpenticola TaxID=3344827 RepID=UPI00369F21A3
MTSQAIERPRRFRRAWLRTLGHWLRLRQVWMAAGILAVAMLAAQLGPPAWVVVTRAFGVPYCLKYSDVYLYTGGAYQRRGADWVEMPIYRNVDVSHFAEIKRNADFIYLVNAASRTNAQVNTIVIRLPVCGGVSQVTVSSAPNWIDSHPVWR